MEETSASLRPLPTEKQGPVTSSNHPLNDPPPPPFPGHDPTIIIRTTPEISSLLNTSSPYNSHFPPFLPRFPFESTTHSSSSAGIEENDERMKQGERENEAIPIIPTRIH